VVTRPREVLPNQFYLVTRSCSQRQFLLTPDDEINNAIAYCLADASKRFKIDVLITTVESNHHHTVIYDRYGRFPRFIEHFHKMVAKCVNRRRGRRENLWASGEACVTRLLDYETILAKLAYTAANPVKDMLVERATQWPGLNGYRLLIHQKTLMTRRPRFYFRADRGWPEEIPLTFTIPSELGDREEVLEDLQSRVETYEADTRRLRLSSGRGIVGRKAVLENNWRESPRSAEPKRELRPRFAGLRENRKEALTNYLAFLAHYRRAREQWIRYGTGAFPPGTYWLAQFTPLAMLAAG
jgi:REP-associated tyrosine transposase